MNKKKVKIISILIAIVIIIFGGVYVADLFLGYEAPEIKKLSDSNLENIEDVKLTAHRGFSGIAPENTLVAFEKAGEYGFYATECDVHLTKDGVWVIYHDDNIFRLTNGYKNIEEATYEELQEYVIDNGVNVDYYPNQKIPTLEEYLIVCKDMKIIPQIEIKNGRITFDGDSEFQYVIVEESSSNLTLIIILITSLFLYMISFNL